MREVIAGFLALFICFSASGQEIEGRRIIGGYGYYESLFIGGEYKSEQGHLFRLGMGNNFGADGLNYGSVFGSYGVTVGFREKTDFDLGLGKSVIYWRQADDYLVMGNLGLRPKAWFHYLINPGVLVGASIGPQLNINLHNKRLGFEKTGYPKKFDVNFSFNIAYEI